MEGKDCFYYVTFALSFLAILQLLALRVVWELTKELPFSVIFVVFSVVKFCSASISYMILLQVFVCTILLLTLHDSYAHWMKASPWLIGANPRDLIMPVDGDDGFYPTGNELVHFCTPVLIVKQNLYVFSTLSFSGSSIFSRMTRAFDVIIDEVAQAVSIFFVHIVLSRSINTIIFG